MDIEPFDATRGLARIEKSAIDQVLHCAVEVNIFSHVGRTLAPQFQSDTGKCACGCLFNPLACQDRTGETNKIYLSRADDAFGISVAQEQILYQALWQPADAKAWTKCSPNRGTFAEAFRSTLLPAIIAGTIVLTDVSSG